MNVEYARVSPISPLISDIRYLEPCKRYGRMIFTYRIDSRQKTRYRPISRSTRPIFKTRLMNIQVRVYLLTTYVSRSFPLFI